VRKVTSHQHENGYGHCRADGADDRFQFRGDVVPSAMDRRHRQPLHENLLLHNVTVDRRRLHESHEAWVFVRIDAPKGPFPLFEGLGPFPLDGVLTWTNTD